jgi:hypothetical protein
LTKIIPTIAETNPTKSVVLATVIKFSGDRPKKRVKYRNTAIAVTIETK